MWPFDNPTYWSFTAGAVCALVLMWAIYHAMGGR